MLQARGYNPVTLTAKIFVLSTILSKNPSPYEKITMPQRV